MLESYLRSLDSDATRRSYKRQVEVALGALPVATLAELTGEMLLDWRAHVTASGLAPATQSQALAALRSFLRWSGALGAHGLPDAIIAKTLPSPRATVRKPYQVLSEPESARLLAAAQTPRDRALVSLLLGAGLRAGELVALDVSDVRESDDGEATIYVRLGKGRKDRQVPIRAEVARCIRSYLASSGRTLGGEGPLLLSADRARRRADRRLSARAVGYLIERLCEDAAIDAKKISPHSLRHGYALRALRQGRKCQRSRSSSATRASPRPPLRRPSRPIRAPRGGADPAGRGRGRRADLGKDASGRTKMRRAGAPRHKLAGHHPLPGAQPHLESTALPLLRLAT